jgi:hypothetical protein
VGPIRLDNRVEFLRAVPWPGVSDVALGYATAPLYMREHREPASCHGFGQTDAQGKPTPPVQAEGTCPSTFRRAAPDGFFNRLTLTFSIGQAF